MGLSTAGSREINVTPLIDVLLVLLIIFLVAIPILLPAETVAIPPEDAGGIPEAPPLTLRVDPDLSVSFDDGPRFPGRELATRLRSELPRVGAVFVDAGEAVPWGVVVSTVDTVRGVAGGVRRDGMTVALRLHDP
jgi:biopolymer transport protein ExbD